MAGATNTRSLFGSCAEHKNRRKWNPTACCCAFSTRLYNTACEHIASHDCTLRPAPCIHPCCQSLPPSLASCCSPASSTFQTCAFPATFYAPLFRSNIATRGPARVCLFLLAWPSMLAPCNGPVFRCPIQGNTRRTCLSADSPTDGSPCDSCAKSISQAER